MQKKKHEFIFTDKCSNQHNAVHVNEPQHTTVLWPFFRDHPGKLVPEENFLTLWWKGRLTEADTPAI